MNFLTQLVYVLALFPASLFAQEIVNFANPIPPGYDASLQIPQFADLCPDMTLPAGHVYVKVATKQGWTTQQIMDKGVTHWTRGQSGNDVFFSHVAAYAKRQYNNVPRTREIFGLTGPGKNGKWWPEGFFNESQARARARQCDIRPRLWVGETMEGDDYVGEGEPMWNYFYDELVKRYEAQKAQDRVPYYIAHNYFTRWPAIFNLGQDTRAHHESLYNTNWQKWPPTLFTPGQNLGKPNTVLEGIYVNVPDLTRQQLLAAIMHMELSQKMGKYAGLFVFNVHEWHPGFSSRVDYPEGTFYRSDKIPLDPNVQIAMAFLAQEYGTVWIEWGLNSFMSPTKKPMDFFPQNHIGKDNWYPNGQTTPSNPCPFYAQSGPNRYGPLAYLGDMTHFGTVLWNETGGQVAGGTPYYATYKIDDGPWITRQPNESDLVASYFEQRGVARVRILGSKMLICYFNFFADNLPHKIQIQNPLRPSQTFTGTVCGNGVHAGVVRQK